MENKKINKNTYKRLLSEIKPFNYSIIIAFIFVFVSVIFDLMAPLIQKNLIDNYITDKNFDLKMIVILLIAYLSSRIVFIVFKYLSTYRFNKIGNQITKRMRDNIFEKLQNMGMTYFDKTPVGSVVSRVTNDTEAIQDMFVNVISVILINVIMVIGILIVMFSLNVTMALISLIFVPIAIFFMQLYQKLSTKHYQEVREKNSQINTLISESITGMKLIQKFNQEERMINEFSKLNEAYYKESVINLKIEGILLAPMIHILTAIVLSILMMISGINTINGHVVLAGTILAFIDLTYYLFEPMFQIMDRLSILQQALVSAERVYTVMDDLSLAPSQNNLVEQEIKEGKIEFKNLSFSYDGQIEVLKNVSFTVNPGETIAIVGHTGSGKTSVINVLMRFYEYTKGDILIDDISIKDYPIETLRQTMSLVLQEPFIYHASVYDNVRLLNENVSDEAIQKACEFVDAASFIKDLEDNYEHIIIEKGASLSSGQKQLLAFARAIVLDPKILILDEATANIDTETESLIQEGLKRIQEGRTNIVIAHRLSTIKDADHIIVLENGEVVEMGNHGALLEEKGRYFHMIELQNNFEL